MHTLTHGYKLSFLNYLCQDKKINEKGGRRGKGGGEEWKIMF